MMHLGDITKVSSFSAPTVDVVIGGSPFQDLSVAGKRAALPLMLEAGVDDYRSDAQVEHYVMPGEGRHPGDITRSWTVVRGGKSKPPKAYNRNGLVPKG